MPETVVLLHGFGGTRRTWDGVIERLDGERYLPLALDLPGHGEDAGNPGPESFGFCVDAVLDRAPERFALCGYSLGGRVAMHVALAVPERVTRLVAISAGPGIEDPDERSRRRAADGLLADELETVPFEEFIERWRSQPLFDDEPPAVGELARADHRRNDPLALAAVLRALGPGDMAPLWQRLEGLRVPLTYVAGGRDTQYLAIGERLAREVPVAELVVLAGGHGLPLENPAGIARVLEGVDPEAGA